MLKLALFVLLDLAVELLDEPIDGFLMPDGLSVLLDVNGIGVGFGIGQTGGVHGVGSCGYPHGLGAFYFAGKGDALG